MINRVLLRIKVIQLLYSYYQSNSTSAKDAEKELFNSIDKTYDLFHLLLLLAIDITLYAEEKVQRGKNKFRPTEEERNPNPRFMLNLFVRQLKSNEALLEYAKERKLDWTEHPELAKTLFDTIATSDIYKEYMSSKEKSYEEDKKVWRRIYNKVLLGNEDLETALEEMNVYWNDDVEIVVSFVVKTLKRFEQESKDKQPLMPQFKDEDDRVFVKKLFADTIKNGDKYRDIIRRNITNWELERVALMDTIIMQTALAELMTFPAIPVNVTLNEYIELAKTYSTEKSGMFVNGVLNNVVNELRETKKLKKAASISND
jgi:N utilization substance protein B